MQEALTAVIGLGDGTCDLQRGARSRARLNAPPEHTAAWGLPQPEWRFVFNTPQWISHEFV